MVPYNFIESLKRIDDLIDADVLSSHLPFVPTQTELTENNVTVANSTVVYIRIKLEISNQEKITLNQYKPFIAFMNETANIVKGNDNCRDISFVNDAVQIIYSTPKKVDVDSVIDDVARIRTLYMIINKKFEDTNALKLSATVGVDYGQLMLLPFASSYDNKSFVWYGQPLINAKSLTEKNTSDNIFISEVIWNNIKPENQRLFKQNSLFENYYEGNIINVIMNNWLVSK